ncbi:MAG: ribonuclease R [Culicoidibacterales bacterium]
MTEHDILSFLQQRTYFPMRKEELANQLNIKDEDREAFFELLVAMEHDYLIYRSKNDRYLLPQSAGIYTGVLVLSDRGYGFVDVKEPVEQSFFIERADLNGGMQRDVVLIRVKPESNGPKKEAEVLKVIDRGLTQIVGTVDIKENNMWRIVPDDKRLSAMLVLMEAGDVELVPGHKVMTKVEHIVSSQKLLVSFVSLLGYKDDPGVDITSMAYSSGVPIQFSEEAENFALHISEDIDASEIKRRRDLRKLPIVTIDGADAKDLDDAVYVDRLDNGNFKLGVHIADVSFYVTEDNPLDVEAYKRGTSVYLADRVIPMIPQTLSNGVCSLQPQVDRLTLSCEMEIDGQGNVIAYDVFESVIHSHARMTYDEVNQILAEDKALELSTEKQAIKHLFPLMEELASILRSKRQDRGAIDFNLEESKIIVDENGKAIDIVKRERGKGERLIEEFMLAANETVASHFYYAEVPAIYRVHEEPKASKLQTFVKLAQSLGYPIKGNLTDVHPKALQAVLKQIEGTDAEEVLSTMLLRSLAKARYSEEVLGHYGLATKLYTHFTSPIRRYPDLMVHRLLRSYFFNEKIGDKKYVEHMEKYLPLVAENTSTCEQRSVQLERDVTSMKMAEYMESHIGERFTGKVSSITGFGIFVTLENLVEGLVHISEMRDDHYLFVEQLHILSGQRTGKKFRMGQEVEIIVARASKERSEIDFLLITDKMSEETIHILSDKAKKGKINRGADKKKDFKARDGKFQKSTKRFGERNQKRSDGDRPRYGAKKPGYGKSQGYNDTRRRTSDSTPQPATNQKSETRYSKIKGRERRRDR